MAMPKPDHVEKLSTEICLREIPRSEIGVSEADDYILHFCGTEYYARQAQSASEEDDTAN